MVECPIRNGLNLTVQRIGETIFDQTPYLVARKRKSPSFRN